MKMRMKVSDFSFLCIVVLFVYFSLVFSRGLRKNVLPFRFLNLSLSSKTTDDWVNSWVKNVANNNDSA